MANKEQIGAKPNLVLGLETSCDETAAAIVLRATDGSGRILSSVVRSQWEKHRPFGGVVPEIAARAHVECLDVLVREAMREADTGFDDLAGVAATSGPGLIGGLIVGAITGKAIALAQRAAVRRRASPRGARPDRGPHRGRAAALPAAAGVGRAYATPHRARRRAIRAPRHDHRRCARRSLRQDGEAVGPRLPGRPGGRAGRTQRATRVASTCRGRCLGARSRTFHSPD